MDVSALAPAGVASGQQQIGLLAIKNAADSQKLLANLLDKAAQEAPAPQTSGSVGTTINTTA